MRRFSRTVLRNSAFGMAAQVVIKLLSFGFSVLIVRNLGAAAFGQYMAVLAFGALFVSFADLGLSPYLVREVARWRDAPDGSEHVKALYGNVLLLRLLLSLLTAALLIGAAWLTHRPSVMVGAIALGTLGLIMYSVQGTSEAMLNGFERLDLSSGARVLNQLMFVLVGAVALLLTAGYYGLIIANLVGVALMTFACWRGVNALGIHPGRVVARNWPILLRASLPFGVIGFTLGLSYKFDSVLLNIFRSDAETGYYNAAYNLVFSAVLFSNAINTALYPSLARQAASAPQALPHIYERALRYLLMVALPIAVGTWALADQIVPFLFKAAYLPAIPALRIIIWVVPLMFTSELLGYIIVVAGKESRVARAIVISTSVNVAANLILVPRFGFMGAAVMTVVTEAVLVGQYLWILRSTMRQINWRNTLVRSLVAVLLMGAVALALRPHLPFPADAAVAAGAYAVSLLALGVVGKDEVRFMRGILSPSEVGAAQ